jgi:hypothetical protein
VKLEERKWKKGYVKAALGESLERSAGPFGSALGGPIFARHCSQKTMPDENRTGAT